MVKANGFVGSDIEDFVGATGATDLMKKMRPDTPKAVDEAVSYMVGLLLPEVTSEDYNDELNRLVTGQGAPRNPNQHRGSNEYADRSKIIRKGGSWR